MPSFAFHYQPYCFTPTYFLRAELPYSDSFSARKSRFGLRSRRLAHVKQVLPCIPFSVVRQRPLCYNRATSTESVSSKSKTSVPLVWDVPASSDSLIFILDAASLITHVQQTFSVSSISSSRFIISRTIRAFAIILTTLLKQHVRGSPVLVVFPQVTHFFTDAVSCVISSAAHLCRALGLSVIRAEAEFSRVEDVVNAIVQVACHSRVRSIMVSADNYSVLFSLLDDPWVSALVLRRGGTFESVTCGSLPTVMDVKSLQPSQIIDILALVTQISTRPDGSISTAMHLAAELVSHFGSLDLVLEAAKHRTSYSVSLVPHRHSMMTYRLAKHLIVKENQISRFKHKLLFNNVSALPLSNWSSMQRKSVDVHDVLTLVNNLKICNNNLITRMLQTADDVPDDHLLLRSPNYMSRVFDNGPTQTCNSDGLLDNHVQTRNYRVNPLPEEIAGFLRNISDHIGILPVFSNKSDCHPTLRAISICHSRGSAMLIHIHSNRPLPDPVVRVLVSKSVEKRGWFLKDLTRYLLSNCGIILAGRLFDIHIASSLLHAGSNLTDANIAERYLSSKNTLQRYLNNYQIRNLTFQLVSEHPLELCDVGLSLAACLHHEITSVGLGYVMFDIECPLIPVLASMEATGVPIDAYRLRRLHEKLRHRRLVLKQRLQTIISHAEHAQKHAQPLTFTSMKDVKMLLGPSNREDESGPRKFDFRVRINQRLLSKVAQDNAVDRERRLFAHLLLRYKKVTQLLQMHTIPLLRNIDCNSCVYPTYVQNAAASGRLSTSKPNLQSLPTRSIVGGELRSLVRAREGKYIVIADYSQIELRIVASMSDDANLKDAFANDVDVHKHIAAELFKTDTAAISDEQRAVAKQVVYSIIYGVSAHGLSEQLDIARRDADMLISHFFESYSSVKLLTDYLVEEVLITGYAKTLFGRRQRVSHIVSGSSQERKKAERVAINMPVQGTQADMLKVAMSKIWNRLSKMESRIIMQMHDELVLEVDEMEIDVVIKIIVEEMVQTTPLHGVDIVVKVGCGKTWHAAVKSAKIVKLQSNTTDCGQRFV